VIFVTTAKSKCFGCGKSGHLIRNCPDKLKENEVNNENNVDVVPGTSETPEAVLLNCEAPGVSRAEPESVVTGKDPPGEGTLLASLRLVHPRRIRNKQVCFAM